MTSFSFASFGGAELNTVELAEQLVEFGAEPSFFTYDDDGPLADFIEDKFKTKIINDDVNLLAESESELGYTNLNISDYDYIWVAANIIPISIIKQIQTCKKLPKFIFIHMSSLEGFPMDAPLLPELERNIASAILSIGQSTTDKTVYRIMEKDALFPIELWPNPAPRAFAEVAKRRGVLKKIAVISSSHPTNEVIAIKDLMKERGVEVDYIGRFNNNHRIVDGNLYDEYDLIIGIGKNAKYSLVSGVPIYIYGRFGGNGYITEELLDRLELFNLSGRGGEKKTPIQIVDEVINGYTRALSFHETHRKFFIEKFSIERVARRLFEKLEQEEPKTIALSRGYINWLVSMQINFMQNLKRFGGMRALESRIEYFEAKERELNLVYESRSWRLMRPLRWFAGLARRLRSKNKV